MPLSALSIRSLRHALRPSPFPLYEFHVSLKARKKYSVNTALFRSTGNLVFPNYRAVHELTAEMNRVRGIANDPQQRLRAGYVNAAGLLDEIAHFLVRIYDEVENPGAVGRALAFLKKTSGTAEVRRTLLAFIAEFPPMPVFSGVITAERYLDATTAGRRHTEVTLEELIMLYLANQNPALRPLRELFDDSSIASATPYHALFAHLDDFFAKERPFGPDRQPFLTALRAPMLSHPESIEAQIGFLKERWGIVLTGELLERIEGGAAFSEEEERYLWNVMHPPGGTPAAETFVPVYPRGGASGAERRSIPVRPEDYLYEEPQRFTADIDWMPNVVIIAKNTYVWLDQLSKKYARPIRRLNEIPDEELDQLARWNFTGLWLIGVWERSSASKRIKQINGNSDAVSSAYSLYDYEIAAELGGEEAFQDLNRRAWQRGIRLAGDMVPNHMGIYSKWVIEHPEFFIQSEHPPYPNYRFTGPDLSEQHDVELRIEDGYWSRSDAAVVFQRVDKRNGEVRYLYHGNDGTSMPWNDTAQLNLIRADVREAVIGTIFHVARKFSVIRFDAAMTLAKKHYQRLWYPMPGTSGVPSRQDHALSRAEFDALFPNEFWREVVDRINREMPQTLLLAEAFWLMEGYFVRTLGMHRVYNSAFMHMLMKEENGKFRALLRNTLEFNPEILKRYVNFMSNPDEQTAVEQFGKDDKYFGVALLMVTLPGLPMFAHGQVEGYREKYGMEYQRAYYQETPDEWLVRRHERELFPLMHKRWLFSGVEHFELFDFVRDGDGPDENVFVFSNRAGNERAFVVFHNAYAETEGSFRHSLQRVDHEGGALRSVSLAHALGLRTDEGVYYRFRELRTNLEHLVTGRRIAEEGWRMRLHAFQYAVFTDFAEMTDTDGVIRAAAERVGTGGVESVERLVRSVRLEPFHAAVRRLGDAVTADELVTAADDARNAAVPFTPVAGGRTEFLLTLRQRIDCAVRITSKRPRTAGTESGPWTHPSFVPIIVLHHLLTDLAAGVPEGVKGSPGVPVVTELLLDAPLHDLCARWNRGKLDTGMTPELLVMLLRNHRHAAMDTGDDAGLVEHLFNDFETADHLGMNQHELQWYFNKESFERLYHWMAALRFIGTMSSTKTDNPFDRHLDAMKERVKSVIRSAERSGYKVDRLQDLLEENSGKKDSGKKAKISSTVRSEVKGTKKHGAPSNVKKVTRRRKDR